MKHLLLLLPFLACTHIARAGALLKPTLGDTRNLQPRAMDIHAQVDGAFAKTTITTLYANSNPSSIEADFVYAAPPGAVVTGFAYWFGKEKVVARISDRERAAQIYKTMQGAVDPALVEMTGKNVFRARIAQVAARQDLRVEIELAAPLEREAKGLVWRYPLVEDTRDVTLDWLRVRVESNPNVTATNNMGADQREGTLLWRKYNFKPSVDARVAFTLTNAAATNADAKPTVQPLQADLSAEHQSDGKDGFLDEGFFALDLKSATNPSSDPQLSGIATRETTKIERPSPGVARLFGRYSGWGDAVVTWGEQKIVVFFPRPPQGDAREVPRLVEALWGAKRIEDLSADPKNQVRVQTLSHRLGLPSKYTSWLAMPAAQRRDYDEQIRRLDTQRKGAELGRVVAMEIEAGHPFSPAALQARARLRALERSSVGRKTGFVEQDVRLNSLRVRMKELAKIVVSRRLGLTSPGERDADKRLAVLAQAGVQDERDFLDNAQQGLRYKQVKALKATYTNQVCALRGDEPKVQNLKKQITALENRYGIADDDFGTKALKLATQVVAKTTLEEAIQGREDSERAARLRDTGEKFSRELGDVSFEKTYFQPQIEARLGQASDILLEEIEAGRENSERAQSAKREVEALYALEPGLRGNLRSVGSREWQRDLAWRARAHETAYRLAQTKRDRPSDDAKISDLQGQLDYLSNHTEQDAGDFEKIEADRMSNDQPLETARQYRLRPGDPLISVKAPQDAREVVALLPDGTIAPLAWNEANRAWETRFDVPAFLRDGAYTIGILVVTNDGKRQKFSMPFSVDTQKPGGMGEVGGDGGMWNLKFLCDSRTERVSALLPWGRVELKSQNGVFGAQTPVPAEWQNRKARVRFLVTDKAHNRTEIAVDWR